MHAFKEAWADLDPHCSGYIPLSELTSLLMHMPAPLGVQGMDGRPAKNALGQVLTTSIPYRCAITAAALYRAAHCGLGSMFCAKITLLPCSDG